ncbi:MAG: hypothetical protein OEY49_14905, partial [Candidatus Heimdallarchaeota archaeon]|nr:hypothetical protein [Candidatus Heimdallarchaeota archaeon]
MNEVYELWQEGKYTSAIQLIDKQNVDQSFNKNVEILNLLLKTLLLLQSENKTQALKVFEDISAIMDQTIDTISIHNRTYKRIIEFSISNTSSKELIIQFDKLEKSSIWKDSDIANKIFQGYFYQYYGLKLMYNREELIKSTSLLKQSLIIFQSLNFKLEELKINHRIARNYYWLGELEKGIELITSMIELSKKNNINNILGANYNLYGSLLFLKGDIIAAKKITMLALELDYQYNDIHEEAAALISLGKIHLSQGEIDLAKKCFIECYKLRIPISSQIFITDSLVRLIQVFIIDNNLNETEMYYAKLVALYSQSNNNSMVYFGMKLAEALILKSKKRMIHISNGQAILNDLANIEFSYFEYQVIVIFNLVEILFNEYLQFKEPQIILEINQLLEKLTTKEHSSYAISGTILFIRYKLCLLINNTQLAEKLLLNLVKQAQHRGFFNIALQSAYELENFNNLSEELVPSK